MFCFVSLAYDSVFPKMRLQFWEIQNHISYKTESVQGSKYLSHLLTAQGLHYLEELLHRYIEPFKYMILFCFSMTRSMNTHAMFRIH